METLVSWQQVSSGEAPFARRILFLFPLDSRYSQVRKATIMHVWFSLTNLLRVMEKRFSAVK